MTWIESREYYGNDKERVHVNTSDIAAAHISGSGPAVCTLRLTLKNGAILTLHGLIAYQFEQRLARLIKQQGGPQS